MDGEMSLLTTDEFAVTCNDLPAPRMRAREILSKVGMTFIHMSF